MCIVVADVVLFVVGQYQSGRDLGRSSFHSAATNERVILTFQRRYKTRMMLRIIAFPCGERNMMLLLCCVCSTATVAPIASVPEHVILKLSRDLLCSSHLDTFLMFAI